MTTYLIGETALIPAVFVNQDAVELPVPDSSVSILYNTTIVLPPTPMVYLGGGRYVYAWVIPAGASLGAYSAYTQGTLGGNLQTYRHEFEVSDKHTKVMDKLTEIKLDIQSSENTIKADIAAVQTDIGNPSALGTSLTQQLADIQTDIGDPSAAGQSISSKLDDVKVAMGLGVTLGTVNVTGKFVDPLGNPISGVRIIAYSQPTGVAVNTAISDASGNFSIYLNPGSYTIEFFEECKILKTTMNLNVPLNVVALPQGNIVLTIKKKVTDKVMANNLPLEGVIIKAYLVATYDANSNANVVEAIANTNAQGVFTLDLFPGDYVLVYSKPGFLPLSQQRQVF